MGLTGKLATSKLLAKRSRTKKGGESVLGRRLAVVEDDAAQIKLLQEFAEEELGIKIDIHGVFNDIMLSHAFDLIKERGPGVVLIDLNLGAANGAKLIDLLNADQQTRRIWKIVTTSDVWVSKRRLILREHHADDIVEKPYELDDLREAILHGFNRAEELRSDPSTGIPGIEQTQRILPDVFELEVPWAVLSTDWNGWGGLLETVGPDVAEQALKKVNQRWAQVLAETEDPRYRFLGQLGKSDGAIIVCRAENVASIGQKLMPIFEEEVRSAYLTLVKNNEGEKILKRGYAIRTDKEARQDKRIPVTTLSVGVNSNVWFRGKLSFATDDPQAWQFEPQPNAPRPMFFLRLVRWLADKARLEAERLAKANTPYSRSVVVFHNDPPWTELTDQEKEEWQQKNPRRKVRQGRLVEVNDAGVPIGEEEGNG